VDVDSVKLVSGDVARRLVAVPLYRDKEALVVAMADPLNIFGVDDIRKAARMESSRLWPPGPIFRRPSTGIQG
jgi:hypothetical protein